MIGHNVPEIEDCYVDMNVSTNFIWIIIWNSEGSERKRSMRIKIEDISIVSKGTEEV